MKFYNEGPGKLWVALWGSIVELVDMIRAHSRNSPKMSFENAMREIESHSITSGISSIDEFALAIAHYRYLVAIDPYGRAGDGNGFGQAYSAFCSLKHAWLTEGRISQPLRELGVLEEVESILTEIEKNRAIHRPQWVMSIEVGVKLPFGVERAA